MGDLELLSRLAVEGYLAGKHRSLKRGYGGEFVQYRPYVPGDDAKYVDWKLYARQGRLCMKSFREETDMRVALVLDASASMAYRGQHAICSKSRYAVMAAACLAYLAHHQGDQVGLFVYGGQNGIDEALANSQNRSLSRLLEELAKIAPEGNGRLHSVIPRVEDYISGRGVTVILSDLHNEEEGLENCLKHLHYGQSDVIVFQILDDDELTLPFGDGMRFVDSEDGRQIDASADVVREEYQSQFDEFARGVRDSSFRSQADFVQIKTNTELGKVLSAFLAVRR